MTNSMQSLDQKSWRWGYLLLACSLCLLCGGAVFGFSILEAPLSDAGAFQGDCVESGCESQRLQIGTVYTVASVSAFVCAIFMGAMLDAFGPRITVAVATSGFCVGAILVAVALRTETWWLLYPGVGLFGTMSQGVIAPLVPTSNLFPGSEAMVISVTNGCFDASVLIFLILRTIGSAGSSALGLEGAFFIYAGLCAALTIVVLAVWPDQVFSPQPVEPANTTKVDGRTQSNQIKHGEDSDAVNPAEATVSKASAESSQVGGAPQKPGSESESKSRAAAAAGADYDDESARWDSPQTTPERGSDRQGTQVEQAGEHEEPAGQTQEISTSTSSTKRGSTDKTQAPLVAWASKEQTVHSDAEVEAKVDGSTAAERTEHVASTPAHPDSRKGVEGATEQVPQEQQDTGGNSGRSGSIGDEDKDEDKEEEDAAVAAAARSCERYKATLTSPVFLGYALFFATNSLFYNYYFLTLGTRLQANALIADGEPTSLLTLDGREPTPDEQAALDTAEDEAGRLLGIFGILLPASAVVVFGTGYIMDTAGLVYAFFGLVATAVVFQSVAMIPDPPMAQLATFVLFALYRAFLFGSLGTFLMLEFGAELVGRLVAVIVPFGGLVSLLQYPLFQQAMQTYKADFTVTSGSLVGLAALTVAFPIGFGYLHGYKCRYAKLEEQRQAKADALARGGGDSSLDAKVV